MVQVWWHDEILDTGFRRIIAAVALPEVYRAGGWLRRWCGIISCVGLKIPIVVVDVLLEAVQVLLQLAVVEVLLLELLLEIPEVFGLLRGQGTKAGCFLGEVPEFLSQSAVLIQELGFA